MPQKHVHRAARDATEASDSNPKLKTRIQPTRRCVLTESEFSCLSF